MRLLLTMALLITALVLAGCGSDDDETTERATGPAETTPTTPTTSSSDRAEAERKKRRKGRDDAGPPGGDPDGPEERTTPAEKRRRPGAGRKRPSGEGRRGKGQINDDVGTQPLTGGKLHDCEAVRHRGRELGVVMFGPGSCSEGRRVLLRYVREGEQAKGWGCRTFPGDSYDVLCFADTKRTFVRAREDEN